MTTKLSVQEFYEYLEKSKSKNTALSYKRSLQLFSDYFGKPLDEILAMRAEDWKSTDPVQKRRFKDEIEKFHKWLGEKEQGYSLNSRRTQILGIRELFRYYEMPVSGLSADLSKSIPSTKTFVPTIEQLRSMYKVADSTRDKLVISMAKDLGWRIGDFVQIKKAILPDLDGEPPIAFELITEKEKVIAKSFLSAETVVLLKEYLPSVENNPNPFLFPSNGKGNVDPTTVNRLLKDLAQRANVKVPANKHLSFHAFRKRFISTCADLSIDVNIAKILTGKDVSADMLAYLSEINHRAAFQRVSEHLRLTETKSVSQTRDAVELETKVAQLERMINAIAAIDPVIVEKARAFILARSETLKDQLTKPLEELTPVEILELYGKLLELAKPKKALSDEEKAAYERMLREENGNGNGNGAT